MVVQSYMGFKHPNQIDMLYVAVLKGMHSDWSELQKKRSYRPLGLQYVFKEWWNYNIFFCGLLKNTKNLVRSVKISEDW